MAKDFTVTVTDPARAAEWEAVLGTARLHVRSPIPSRANLPGKPGAEIYLLDLELLTPEQRQRLVAHLAERFGLPVEFVEKNLDVQGVPILAEHCVVAISNPQKWL